MVQPVVLPVPPRRTVAVGAIDMRSRSHPVGSKYSIAPLCGLPIAVTKHATEPFVPVDSAPSLADLGSRLDDVVVQALVVAFGMVVLLELRQRLTQRPLAMGLLTDCHESDVQRTGNSNTR
jgi:hypothetical protein